VLDVALVRMTRPELDPSPAALVERIERVERALRSGAVPAGPRTRADDPPDTAEVAAPPPISPAGDARQAARRAVEAAAPPPPPSRPQRAAASPPPPPAADPPAAGGQLPSRDELTLAWGDAVLKALRPKPRGLYNSTRFLAVDTAAVLAFPSAVLRDMAEPLRPEVEAALATHFGRPVPLRLVVEEGAGQAASVEEEVDLSSLRDAPVDDRTGVERLTQAFPGAEVVDDP
jgi:hypothetical protein